jgi:hypothetical protein
VFDQLIRWITSYHRAVWHNKTIVRWKLLRVGWATIDRPDDRFLYGAVIDINIKIKQDHFFVKDKFVLDQVAGIVNEKLVRARHLVDGRVKFNGSVFELIVSPFTSCANNKRLIMAAVCNYYPKILSFSI